MKPSENYKDVTINERLFRIKKFDALTGGYMLIKISVILAPLIKHIDLNKFMDGKDVKKVSDVNTSAINISGAITELGKLSEDDFKYIQQKCLQLCYQDLPAGHTQVLKDDGTFGVSGLDEDTMTVMALIVHTLMFNVKGFFQGSPLASIVGGFLTTSQQGSKT